MTATLITARTSWLRRKAAGLPLRAPLMAGLAAAALLSACASSPAPAPHVSAPASQTAALDTKKGDGLGGTGIKTAQLRKGDGLGGTGVLGTISGFGSIIVNGLELEFDHTTNVATDGKPASLDELRIGQVVEGVARQKDGKLMLESLDIQHAVSGPIEAIDYNAQTMTVLGQSVRLNLAGDKTAMGGFRTLRAGDQVSVSGLRLSDGTIFASRVDQHSHDDRLLVRSETATVSGDRLRIGTLDVPLVADATVSKPANGGRAFASGRMINGSFVPDVITGGNGLPFSSQVGDVSLEGYAPKGAPLNMYGAAVAGALPAGVAADDHIVVTGQIAPNGSVNATSIAKVRTVVTIMKAQGSQRPAAMRPDMMRPERVMPPQRPETPQTVKPEVPTRPPIERPGSFTGV